MNRSTTYFEWDDSKDRINQAKHGLSFIEAQHASSDPDRVIAKDLGHSEEEERLYCFGRIGNGIATVRFTYRSDVIRIIGAGYWRKGKRIYESENQLHR
jgi:uncharacterized DUF497 family protein